MACGRVKPNLWTKYIGVTTTSRGATLERRCFFRKRRHEPIRRVSLVGALPVRQGLADLEGLARRKHHGVQVVDLPQVVDHQAWIGVWLGSLGNRPEGVARLD